MPTFLAKHVFCLAVAVSLPGPARALDAAGARGLVDSAAKDTVEAFAGRKLSAAEAGSRLQGLMGKYIDVDYESEQILGRFWQRATVEQRQEFARLFQHFIVVAYGGLIDDVPAGLFIQVGEVEGRDNAFLVHSVAGASRQDAVAVEWVVRTTAAGRPVIADVVVDGVALVRARHEEFTSILSSAGGRLDSLLGAIRSKITLLSAQDD
jgi:phospholipid transport system substrate-binding protein